MTDYASNPILKKQAESLSYPALFVSISGSHLYGFPSADSDFDLRGVHIVSLQDAIGLPRIREEVRKTEIHDGLEIDLVTDELKSFFLKLLKRNGLVLEQVVSPLIVHALPEHEELQQLAPGCVTRYHAYHYLGFAQSQWKLFERDEPRRIKPLLYVYRVLLTGIHMMQTGEIEPDLVKLNAVFNLSYIPDLIERKTSGTEKGTLNSADFEFHEQEYQRLIAVLEAAHDASMLPENPSSRDALNDLLIRLRLQQG
ncbi:MAG TPA: nucleotidyltransferase domain-containing protein [Aggregatilineales bacterium]|nr:nucleotidyltransferase domain-containing protein [Aggregatilineales bacterium]